MRFSIICAVYNAENFIDECILSIKNNSFTDWELILMDDNSKDGTFNKCLHYSESDNRIKLFRSNTNIGPYNERINGYLKARGDYILNIDADDTFCTHAFQFLDRLILEQQPDMIVFNENRVTAYGSSVLDCQRYDDHIEKDPNLFFANFFRSYSVCQGLHRKCFKKNLLKNVSLEYRYSKMFEDGLFSLKLLNACSNVIFSNECLYNYRDINDCSLTKKYISSNYFNYEIILEKMEIVKSNTFLKRKTKILGYSVLISLIVDRITYLCKVNEKKKIREILHALYNEKAIKRALRFHTSHRVLAKRYFVLLLFKLRLFSLLSFMLSTESNV